MINPPFSGSIPIYIALGALIVGLALLLGFLSRRVSRLIRHLRRRPVPEIGLVTSTLHLLLIALFISASAATLFLLGFIQSYTAFTHRKRIAVVHCAPAANAKEVMILRLVTVDSATAGRIAHYRLLGQQWAIEGHILKWDDWLNFAGLGTMYKLTHVRGRYLRAEDETSKPGTVYSFVKDEEDPRWHFLYEYGPRLPFVKAVYGNTVFTFPSHTKTYEIYVTTSGFMIQEKE
jgi:hypothetical protein